MYHCIFKFSKKTVPESKFKMEEKLVEDKKDWKDDGYVSRIQPTSLK